jgi:hypothetical protein
MRPCISSCSLYLNYDVYVLYLVGFLVPVPIRNTKIHKEKTKNWKQTLLSLKLQTGAIIRYIAQFHEQTQTLKTNLILIYLII